MLKHGKNIILVPYEPEQCDKLHEWYYSGKYEEFFRDIQPAPDKNYFRSFSQMKSAMVLMVSLIETGAIIGTVMMYEINPTIQKVSFAMLIDKEFEGRRLGLEAGYLVIKYLFEDLNIRKMCIETLSRNSRLAEYCRIYKIRKEGVLKDEAKIGGKFENVIRFAMFKKQAIQFINFMEKK
jgi:RimJ/RimL family protein N-acetyltransferase